MWQLIIHHKFFISFFVYFPKVNNYAKVNGVLPVNTFDMFDNLLGG